MPGCWENWHGRCSERAQETALKYLSCEPNIKSLSGEEPEIGYLHLFAQEFYIWLLGKLTHTFHFEISKYGLKDLSNEPHISRSILPRGNIT